jgi:hypothetical protein
MSKSSKKPAVAFIDLGTEKDTEENLPDSDDDDVKIEVI